MVLSLVELLIEDYRHRIDKELGEPLSLPQPYNKSYFGKRNLDFVLAANAAVGKEIQLFLAC